MDTEPTPEPVLTTYFALQLLLTESPREAVGAMCRAGKAVRTLFRRVELLDTIQVANRSFIRCRSDVTNPYPMLEALLQEKRGFVAISSSGQYTVRLPDGRTGPVTTAVMHIVPRSGQQVMYRGPKIAGWERQFPDS